MNHMLKWLPHMNHMGFVLFTGECGHPQHVAMARVHGTTQAVHGYMALSMQIMGAWPYAGSAWAHGTSQEVHGRMAVRGQCMGAWQLHSLLSK